MVLRPIARREAEHGAGVLEVTVAPAVVGDRVEDVELQRGRRRDAELEHLDDVALTAEDRELPRRRRPVPGQDAADADAERRQAVHVGEMARDRLAPDLASTVEAGRTQR